MMSTQVSDHIAISFYNWMWKIHVKDTLDSHHHHVNDTFLLQHLLPVPRADFSTRGGVLRCCQALWLPQRSQFIRDHSKVYYPGSNNSNEHGSAPACKPISAICAEWAFGSLFHSIDQNLETSSVLPSRRWLWTFGNYGTFGYRCVLEGLGVECDGLGQCGFCLRWSIYEDIVPLWCRLPGSIWYYET